MIRHIVSFRLLASDPAQRHAHSRELRDRLEALRDVDAGVVELGVFFDVGEDEKHWPVILVSTFADREALARYQVHPRHREVVAWMNDGVVGERAAVDYLLTPDATTD